MGYNLAKRKMKRFLLILVAFLGISYAANAQSCTIQGDSDGSTVAVTSKTLDKDNGVVKVNLGNDSWSGKCANVTVYVTVTYQDGKKTATKEFTTTQMVCPGIPVTAEVYIDTTNMISWKVEKISGKKCN